MIEIKDINGLTILRLQKETSLVNADLQGISLNRPNLAGLDLSGANLTGTRFHGGNLQMANFSGANLTRALFRRYDDDRAAYEESYVHLTRAVFDGADLTGAYFGDGCRLVGASFRGANLTRMVGMENLKKIGLAEDVDLTGAYFIDADNPDVTYIWDCHTKSWNKNREGGST